MKLPRIKENLLVQELKNEVLIYDKTTNKSYCLNSTAQIVFNACNGKKTLSDVKLPEDIVYLTLDELKRNDLIKNVYVSPFTGMKRREAIRRVGLASLIALPVVYALVVPTATQASSDSCRIDGSCIPVRQNLCAGCAGRAVTFARYPANSNCQGPLADTPQVINCPPNGSSFNSPFTDRIRVLVA